ncbi:ABC transporter substrate-binding protein [Endozoicomonas sp. SM1973]|uniref:ABC transporter substrate-binding protein n=1 Tax=Spartinivicinus marinus TaxID=2994442 RepID=A0A853HYX9_9GAMM|nr:ABC transporter substrate-binding protein [Spartinivicinus marinus]MCX4029679.1 ABC transporter substrate-binding protein [Spartinivicinus marinus]NYZ66940.1 ABC transporter substrate-binding protein [Spartinivicinus marinus]
MKMFYSLCSFGLISLLLTAPTAVVYAKEGAGVSADKIKLGSVLALRGRARSLGVGMRQGLEAAFSGVTVKGKTIEVVFENDGYEPDLAVKATNKLIKENIFLMIGNVGTPTAKVTLPVLAKQQVPAVGFFTGAGLLRPGPGPVINYRASYVQETEAVINAALDHGLKPTEVCAYVQNDAYGMAGLTGIKLALEKANADSELLNKLTNMISMTGDNPPRNKVGPVGVYKRNTREINPGYESLKNWEQTNNSKCRLVVTVGAYDNISQMIRLANKTNTENWIFSAVSFTGANVLKEKLVGFGVHERVIMTQVVPLLNSDLPIVQEAKTALGTKFGFVSLEGYIVGKMTAKLLEQMPSPITRDNFVSYAKTAAFDLGGLAIDFTKNGYQGSDLVIPSYLTKEGYVQMTKTIWESITK